MTVEWLSLLDWWWAPLLLVGFVWAPKTWTPGELVSAAALNTNIRDHLNEGLRTQATTLTGSQDDFALDGPFAYLKCNNASALTVTGALIDSGNVDGARVIVEALNSTVTFKDQDGGSATANRIITPSSADLILAADGRALMVYDGTASRWRVSRVSHSVLFEWEGKVGIGTSIPSHALHVKSTSSSYFIGGKFESTFANAQVLLYILNDAQTWALMIDNSDNFRIRDATAGTADPFSIEAGCPTNTMKLMSDGRIGVGGDPFTSVKLQINSSTGAFLLPRMTTTQRNAITGNNGMMIYNTTTERIESIENGSWVYHTTNAA